MASRELRRIVLPLALLATLVLMTARFAPRSAPPRDSSRESPQIGKILSVQKTLLTTRPFVSRYYPQIRYYLLQFAVRVSDKTYCGEYKTPVLEEIDDLYAAKGKDVHIVLKGKSLTVKTPKGRKLKTWVAEPKHCSPGEPRAVGYDSTNISRP
jgi:hypothetical protein